MSVKKQIFNFLEDKESASLKEIYAELGDVKQHQIRATLNYEVKHGKLFERIGKGTYKLRRE